MHCNTCANWIPLSGLQCKDSSKDSIDFCEWLTLWTLNYSWIEHKKFMELIFDEHNHGNIYYIYIYYTYIYIYMLQIMKKIPWWQWYQKYAYLPTNNLVKVSSFHLSLLSIIYLIKNIKHQLYIWQNSSNEKHNLCEQRLSFVFLYFVYLKRVDVF